MAGGDKDKEIDYVALRANRRVNLRSQLLVLKIKGEDSCGVFFGYAKTIGRGGMFIASVNPREVGEQMEISFMLPGLSKETRCGCEVVWRRGLEPGFRAEPGMGIRFTSIAPEVADGIESMVRSESL
ncbi:MAG: PilZ domain-containing protein [Thermodesulfobacteriota bacterium]